MAKLDGNDSVDLLALDQGGKAVHALLGDGHGEFYKASATPCRPPRSLPR
ncbi:hypothetical protein [Nannocystis pusilla]